MGDAVRLNLDGPAGQGAERQGHRDYRPSKPCATSLRLHAGHHRVGYAHAACSVSHANIPPPPMSTLGSSLTSSSRDPRAPARVRAGQPRTTKTKACHPWQARASQMRESTESHWSDLNRRPLDYESRALPLSYSGRPAMRGRVWTRPRSGCPGADSNRDAFRHYPLKIACLPVSPPGRAASKIAAGERRGNPRQTSGNSLAPLALGHLKGR
jgi:hypothetical protein